MELDNRNESDLTKAAAQLLGTPQPEQPEVTEEEQESPEEETLEVASEEVEVEEVDEDEATDADEVGDDSADEADERQEEETLYTVKVDGEEYEVNLEELTKGYQLEGNYTKKAQALAEERKVMSDLRQGLEAERQQYLELTAHLARQQGAAVEAARERLKTIDRVTDPIGFVSAQAEVQELEQGLQMQAQQFQEARQQQQQAWAQQRAEMQAQAAEELNGMIDGWADDSQRSDIQAGIVKFAQDMGYTPEELNNIVNSRDLVVLNKARLYDELVSKKEVVRKKKAPVVRKKANSPAPKDNQTRKARAVKEKKSNLQRSGTLADAQALILEQMQGGRK